MMFISSSTLRRVKKLPWLFMLTTGLITLFVFRIISPNGRGVKRLNVGDEEVKTKEFMWDKENEYFSKLNFKEIENEVPIVVVDQHHEGIWNFVCAFIYK